jgi:glycosyltransferase involved in cell wall biosynthesis
MQEMKKRSIVIASILKPLTDSRMLEKMGRSLATHDRQVHIIGFGKSLPPSEPNIEFHSLDFFNRISFTRLVAPFKVLRLLIKLKPGTIIINTHELLFVSGWFGLITRTPVIYDIRENYYLNIINTKAFPAGIRYLIALLVRLKEWMASTVIDHFLLAERSYEKELSFIRKKYSVVENKCKLPTTFKTSRVKGGLKFLFSGTLDESTGVFQAIQLAKELHGENSEVSLKIIGYCAMESTRIRIQTVTKGHDFISITGLYELVDHQQILDEIAEANAGIIFYPTSPHTEHCIPTKLYEYMAAELPIIYDKKVFWRNLVVGFGAGMEINFEHPMVSEIIFNIQTQTFYPNHPAFAHWESEEKAFLGVIDSL